MVLLFGSTIYILYLYTVIKKTHTMLFLAKPIEAVSYKDEFTTFLVKKHHEATPVEFVNYDDALLYLNGIIKNEPDCDDYWLDAYCVDLGLQTLHYVHEKKIYNYQFTAPSAGY